MLTAGSRYCDEMRRREESVRIHFADGRWTIAEDNAADVTVACGQGDLASLFMGSCELAGRIRLGAVSVSGEARAQEFSRLLHCGQKPWLNSDY